MVGKFTGNYETRWIKMNRVEKQPAGEPQKLAAPRCKTARMKFSESLARDSFGPALLARTNGLQALFSRSRFYRSRFVSRTRAYSSRNNSSGYCPPIRWHGSREPARAWLLILLASFAGWLIKRQMRLVFLARLVLKCKKKKKKKRKGEGKREKQDKCRRLRVRNTTLSDATT